MWRNKKTSSHEILSILKTFSKGRKLLDSENEQLPIKLSMNLFLNSNCQHFAISHISKVVCHSDRRLKKTKTKTQM